MKFIATALLSTALLGSVQADNTNFFADVSFIYWQASIGDLAFAGRDTTHIFNPNLAPPKHVFSNIDIIDPEFDFCPGVQASIAYSPSCSDWVFALEGTYLPAVSRTHSHLPSKISPPQSPTFIQSQVPLINPEFMGTFAQDASAKWTLTFGTLDLIAGGYFAPWKCIYLMPNFGLRGAWIDQKFTVNYDGVAFATPFGVVPPTLDAHSDVTMKSEFRAIGFVVGTDFEVPLFCNISLVGGVDGSLLFGRSKISDQIHGFNVERNGMTAVLTTVSATENEKIWPVRGNVETELGLAYEGNFCCFGYGISLTYMFSLWFDQNDFHNFTFTPVATPDVVITSDPVVTGGTALGLVSQNFIDIEYKNSNLQMHGLVLTAGISF